MARPADPHAKVDLLRAAEAVFVEHGLDLAKVEDITARAGRSKGSFYLHFASKEDAFRQIVEGLLARFAAYIEEEPPVVGPCPDDGAVRVFFARWLEKDVEIFEFIWMNRGLVRLLLEGGKSASFGYLIDEFAERARARTAEALAAGQASGIFRADLDVELASLILAGAYDRVARHLVRLGERPDLRRWAQELHEVLLPGIAGPLAEALAEPAATDRSLRPRRPGRRTASHRSR